MKWTSLNELREKYLSFFENKGHLRLKSFSLVPENDKSLLLINAGMAPLKKYFTGEEVPPRKRVTTCQKCCRTLDIDEVGMTARHATYFEMLGNFSFGDYFKEEAIKWAWEFLTEVLEIPSELLYPSIYEQDDEAFEIWNKVIGVPSEKIIPLGRKDNFWEHGSGPCGPCSEIYFDRGEKYGCGSPDCKPGCDCDRFIEIWNNVFTQFSNDGEGNYTELSQKNIDTGMGLERLACVMQGVDSLFEVDSIRKILDAVLKISGKNYGEEYKTDVSVRIITDHIRSSVFLICDGVLPSNEGRGYVLRRLLRRAARHGKLLGIKDVFLSSLSDVVIEENKSAYPELAEKSDYIKKIITLEEERFNATIDSGLVILMGVVEKAKKEGSSMISGKDVFQLYDTFGFPMDLTREIVGEHGLTIDEAEFSELMKEQKERARAARADISGWDSASSASSVNFEKTVFEGYDKEAVDSIVLGIIKDEILTDHADIGDNAVIILDRTVMYGEGGGQVGDTGVIFGSGCNFKVTDTKKNDGVYLHVGTVEEGQIRTGDKVTVVYDEESRKNIRKNHSAVHLLQAALRQVLGSHVEQAGSYVDKNRFRFDFNHFEPMTDEEILRTEAIINTEIMKAYPITTVETDMESAVKAGAMALFGEKYGSTVRMVQMGDFSVELCGGTHAENTGNLGLCKIISENSVASGIRRIEGVCGAGYISYVNEKDELIKETATVLKAQSLSDILRKAAALNSEISGLKKEVESLNSKIASSRTSELLSEAEAYGKVKLITQDLGNVSLDVARKMGDDLKEKCAEIIAVLAIHDSNKMNFICVCGKEAVKSGAHAGNILREVSSICGGKGGGRPDSATSGGKDLSKINDALSEVKNIIAGMI